MTKIGTTLLAALALGALVPAGAAMAQPAHRPVQHAVQHPAPHPTVVKKTVVKQTTVRKTAHKKVTCRYVVQHGRKVKVCR